MRADTRSIALVTGASGGVGRATAARLARCGFRIAVHYHSSQTRAEATLQALDGTGHALFGAELADSKEAKALVDRVVAAFGRLDVLVNNAAVGKRLDFAECDFAAWDQTWQRVLDVNLVGPANLSFCAAKHMLARGGGRIVNVSSRGAFVGEPEQPWYGASKAGLNSLGQSLARLLARDRVYVYTVAPGFIDTPMSAAEVHGPRGDEIRAEIPLGRVTTPEEVAETIAFLATDAPAAMTGAIVDVNGASYLRT